MSAPALDQRLLEAALGLRLDDPGVPAAAATLARAIELVSGGAAGALFDVEPSHHARLLEAAAAR
jgi:hypothetical protein